METITTMTVNENGNVNVETLKIKQELFQKTRYWKTLAKS